MEDVSFYKDGAIGYVALSRPQALNALTLEMISSMGAQLDVWASALDVLAVVVRGEGKAFCAGGDVKATAQGTQKFQADYFRQEYTNNRRIFHYPKPYIALADGIVMGGGAGISWHGLYRIVTENTLFAMPETGIGLFPDVGTGYALTRCPGRLGMYLALTGARLGPADCMEAGYGTQFVPSGNIPALLAALGRVSSAADIDDVLNSFAGQAPGESLLKTHRAAIDRHFAFDRMEDIIGSLEGDPDPWARETLQTLRRMSPTSLKLTLAHQIRCRGLSFDDVLLLDYRLSQFCMQGHDFFEGIRAQLIDKDRSPRWRPATLEEVSDTEIESAFQPLGEKDLVFSATGT